MSFENFAEFEIRADESPAIHAFGRMDAAYKAALARMGQDAESFAKSAGEAWKALAKEQTEALKKLSSGSAKVSIKIKLIEHSFHQASQASKSFADRFYAEVDKMIPTTEAFAVSIVTTLGSAFHRVAQEALNMSVEFEKSLAQISTLLESQQIPQMMQIKNEVLDIFQTGVTGLKDLTGALYTTISYGITDVGTALNVVREAERGAIAGVSKVEIAAKGMVATMNAWGKEAYSAAQINDILFQTVKRAATSFPLLSANLGKVASVASATGISLEETMAAFSAITKAGVPTETAFMLLTNTITGLLKPAKFSRDLFAALGIEIGGAALQSKGIIGVMENIATATGGNIDILAKLFPNIRALRGVTVLAGKGLQNFRDDLGYMKNATGAADEAYKKMSETFWAQSEMLKNTLQTVGLSFGEAFGGVLFPLFSQFAAWVKENKTALSEWASAIGSAIGGIVRIVGEAVKLLWKLTAPIRWLIANNPFRWGDSKLAVKGVEQVTTAMQALRTESQATAKAMTAILGKKMLTSDKEADEAEKQLALAITAKKAWMDVEKAQAGGSQEAIAKAKERLGAAAAGLGIKGWAVLDTKKMMEQVQQIYEHNSKVVEQFEATMVSSRSKVAVAQQKAALEKLHKEVYGPTEKAHRTLHERLAAIDANYAQGSKKWLEQRALAQQMYDKAINRMQKKEQKEPQIAASVRQYQQHLDAVNALTKQEGDAYERLDAKRAELMVKHGVNAELVTKINAWYYDQRKKLDDKEESRLDAIVAKTEKRQQAEREKLQKAAAKKVKDELKASATLGAEAGHAKRDQSAFFGIVLASDAELEKKFGTQLKLVGKNVDMWRSEIMRAYSPDMISYAAAWWGAFTKTGVKGAQDFAGQVQNTIMTMVNTLLGAWQNMWKGIITGQDEAKEPLLATLLDMISSMCAQWGAFLATLAVTYAAMFNWGGMAVALIASAAMFALAGITSGAAANTRGKAQTAEREGNRAARGGGSVGGAFSGSRGSLGGGANNVTIYMGFTFPPTKRQAEEAAVSMGRSVIPAMKNKGYKIPADTIASGVGV